jgi:glycosyltransferase involved in cell wall biosynthesis
MFKMNTPYTIRLKKIILFLPGLSGGGAERTLINLHNNLDRTNINVRFLLGTFINHYVGELKFPNEIYYINKSSSKFRSILNLRQILNAINQFNPDIVLTTLYPSIILLMLMKYSGAIKCKLIVRLSHPVSVCTLMEKMFLKILAKAPDAYVCLSQSVEKDLKKNIRINKKILTIYNPVDVKSIKDKMNKLEPGLIKLPKEYFVFVGRMNEVKNPKLAFDSYVEFKINNKNKNYSILFIGEGPQKKLILTKANNKSLLNNVLCLGWVDNPYPIIKGASALLLTSKYEGFGHVIIEAMCCNTPVVAVNCPGAPSELIQNDFNGYLVEPNQREIAQALEKLINNSVKRKEIQLRARSFADKFAAPIVTKKYEELFNFVLEN